MATGVSFLPHENSGVTSTHGQPVLVLTIDRELGVWGSCMASCFVPLFADWQMYLPIAIGGGVACIVLTILAWKYRPRKKFFEPPIINKTWDETWSPPQSTGADRRNTVRREGQPVPVYLNSAAFDNQTEPAYVVDRSTGGLKIIATKPLPAGSTMQIRAENAPDNIPWITMIVRSCREMGNRFELGCEFEQPPPWNILLLFG